MSLAKRVENVEDNLAPKEAVILWMREAHQFDSLLNYGLGEDSGRLLDGYYRPPCVARDK